MGLETIVDFVNDQKWLDSIAKPTADFVTRLYTMGGSTGRSIQDFLNGTWLKHPVHSATTDIPIGSYTAAIVLDSLEMVTGEKGYGMAADTAVAVGVTGAIASAVTGLTDWQFTTDRPRRVGTMHALLNLSALGFYIASLVFRSQRNRNAGWGTAMIGFGLTLAAAFLGGDLVYKEKMGVDHSPEMNLPEDFTAVMSADSLRDSTLTRAIAGTIPVLLVRRGEKIYAIAETCSHLGGPLSEGTLREDNVVICPWHSSHFCLDDGHLVKGPSVYSQPAFETRIKDGQIEVRVIKDPLK